MEKLDAFDSVGLLRSLAYLLLLAGVVGHRLEFLGYCALVNRGVR
jgi:hypothetical protein